jgi:hypothetical protein
MTRPSRMATRKPAAARLRIPRMIFEPANERPDPARWFAPRDCVLDSGSPLPLSHQPQPPTRNRPSTPRGRVQPKRQKTGAVQNLADLSNPGFMGSPQF